MRIGTVILVNGPPRAGKDSVGKFLSERFPAQVRVDKFARILKERTHALYNVVDEHGDIASSDYYELGKDDANSEFGGLTPRQAYINVSEGYFKKFHGPEFFGEALLQSWERHMTDTDVMVISDSGFREEAEYLISAMPTTQFVLVRLNRGPEYTFKGDSRSYLRNLSPAGNDRIGPYAENIIELDLDSSGTMDEFRARTIAMLAPYIVGLDAYMAAVQLPVQDGEPEWVEFSAANDLDKILASVESARRNSYSSRVIRITNKYTGKAKYVFPGDKPVYSF